MKEFYFKERGIYYRTNEFMEERPTLFFVHGLSGSSSAWIPYEIKFKEKYNIVNIDLRGHGESNKPKKYCDYEIRRFADDIAKLSQYLNIKKFILVSHSLGTLVVFEFLTRYSESVSSIIFLNPSYSVKTGFLSRLVQILLFPIPLLQFFPFSQKKGIHIDYSKYLYANDFDFRRMKIDISNTFLRVYLYCIRQLYNVDYEYFLNQIKLPVLVVHGRDDTVFPLKNSIKLTNCIKNSKLIILDNANHLIVLNNVDEVSVQIENFVSFHR